MYCPAGFFNYIADRTVFDLPATEHIPKLPSGNFTMVGCD
jgi:hypothetical protein